MLFKSRKTEKIFNQHFCVKLIQKLGESKSHEKHGSMIYDLISYCPYDAGVTIYI